MTKYIAKIGLEMHCEMSETKSKVFSTAKNEYSEIPNSNVRPLDMGFPGTLPVVNKEAVRLSLMVVNQSICILKEKITIILICLRTIKLLKIHQKIAWVWKVM